MSVGMPNTSAPETGTNPADSFKHEPLPVASANSFTNMTGKNKPTTGQGMVGLSGPTYPKKRPRGLIGRVSPQRQFWSEAGESNSAVVSLEGCCAPLALVTPHDATLARRRNSYRATY